MDTMALRRVYVWEFPVRLYHWVNALAVAALAVTGFMIGRPLWLPLGIEEASSSFFFGWVRFIHFAAAFVFFFNFIGRIYWSFVGNRYARWDNFVPRSWTHFRKQLSEVIEVLKVDVLLEKPRPTETVGHNAMAAWSYFLMFLAFGFQSVTGFGLYAAMSTSWLPQLFTWIVPIMGGDFAVRQWHHVMLWFFVVFSMIHVYLVFYHDYVEERGEISSMIGGWQFEETRPRA